MVTIALDWERYKRICDTPNVFSRWMLEQTAELTDPLLSQLLEAALTTTPLAKPVDHRGGPSTDMFELELSLDQTRSVAKSVAAALVEGRTSSATRERGLGGFREAWNDYLRYLECRLK